MTVKISPEPGDVYATGEWQDGILTGQSASLVPHPIKLRPVEIGEIRNPTALKLREEKKERLYE